MPRDVSLGFEPSRFHAAEVMDKRSPLPSDSITGTLEIFLGRIESVDRRSLVASLADYYIRRPKQIRVRIEAHELSQNLMHICEKAEAEAKTRPNDDVLTRWRLLPAVLPLFWDNLSELLAQLIREVFSYSGKNAAPAEVVEAAVEASVRTTEYAQYVIGRHLYWTRLHHWARQLKVPEIAEYLERYSPEGSSQGHVVRKICKMPMGETVLLLELEPKDPKRVRAARVYLSGKIGTTVLPPGLRAPTESLVTDWCWYLDCLPQILGEFLAETTFGFLRHVRDREPAVGLKKHDYGMMGLA